MRSKKFRSRCPIASSLDILGDKWTLIVVRDLFRGKGKFSDFMSSPENIKTNILTDRLKWLEENEIILRTVYQSKPTRYLYQLTEKGRDLKQVLHAVASWGETHLEGTFKVTKRKKDSNEGLHHQV
jgi:DNA-binding HxlR family transcriptional regulator